jgi:hypothetical protein
LAANTTVDPLVERLLNETKTGEDEYKRRIRRLDRAYDVYRATGADAGYRARSFSPWQSRLRVPYAMQVIDTALVNMVTGSPRCEVHPRTPDFAERAKSFQYVMDYYTERDHLVEKVPMIMQQGLIYGLTVAKTHWLYAEGEKTVNGIDPLTGNRVPQTVKQITQDGPALEPWDVYDVWWDPNGRDVDTCSYVALRSWMTKADLIAHACDVPNEHERLNCTGLYHNVDELIQTGTTSRTTSTAQERYLMQQQKTVQRRDMYEIVEYWRDDQVTVLGNRKVLLRDESNPHWHGKKPIVIANTRPDVMQLQGIPETELVDHLQQALWTVQNLRMDNLLLTVQRGITYREGGVIDVDALELRPRFKWPVTDHDDIRPFEIQPLPPEAYREEEGLLSRMQLVTGINPYVSGTESVGADQNTATGVSVLTEVASKLLRFKAGQIQYKVFQRVYEQWGADIQQYMTEPVWARIAGPGSEQSFHQVTPDEVQGEFDFKLVGSEESLSQQQRQNSAIALVNACAPLIQLGAFSPRAIAKKVAQAFDIDNPDELLAPAPSSQQSAAPFPPGQNGGAPQPMGQGGPIGPPGLPPQGLPGSAGSPMPGVGAIQTGLDPRVQQMQGGQG